MPLHIHGTKPDPTRQHPVLDIAYWESKFPLKNSERSEGGNVYGPVDLAQREQAVRLAKAKGELGPSVPTDVFVWAERKLYEAPWLTRIGGTPWRPKDRPWPRDDQGVPLVFLGQICFVDSMDILPCRLPGDVVLFFGTIRKGCISLFEGKAIEWSHLKIDNLMESSDCPWNGELPYEYQGVLHRTTQYTDAEAAEPAFKEIGYKEGGFRVHAFQATSIGAFVDLPQGWPFGPGDGNSLIATLSSHYFCGDWPVCDVPAPHTRVDLDGQPVKFQSDDARSFGIDDAGCIYLFCNSAGEFVLESDSA
jgi:Domain of unknown function (DUF1963)